MVLQLTQEERTRVAEIVSQHLIRNGATDQPLLNKLLGITPSSDGIIPDPEMVSAYREAAIDEYDDGVEIQVDDDAAVEVCGTDGAWVDARVWVSYEAIEDEDDDEDDEDDEGGECDDDEDDDDDIPSGPVQPAW